MRFDLTVRRHFKTAIVSAVALAAITLPAVASAAEWSSQAIVLPNGSAGGFLQGVSCPAAGDCVGAGAFYTTPGEIAKHEPMLVTSTGGTWAQASPVTQPGSKEQALLNDVSCDAVGSCVAVGEEGPTIGLSETRPIAIAESGGVWGTAFDIAPPAGQERAVLLSVSCPAAGSCVAVGSDEAGAFGVVETGGTWGSAVQISPPTGSTGHSHTQAYFGFLGVSCVAAGSCVGVGEAYDSADNLEAVAADESGGTWSQSVLIPPPPGTSAPLVSDVGCIVSGECVAIGGSGSQPFAVTETGGSWGAATSLPLPAGSTAGNLSGVSCLGAGSCVAVGSSLVAGTFGPLAEIETAGSWTPTTITPPAGARFASLLSVSCPTSASCAAVGSAEFASGDDSPIAFAGEATTTPSSPGAPAVPAPGPAPIASGPPLTGGNRPACSIALGGSAVAVAKGRAQVKLTNGGAGACTGTVSLSIRAAHRPKQKKSRAERPKARSTTIGKAPLSLAAGKTAVISVRLNGAGKAALKKAGGRLKAVLSIKASDSELQRTVRVKEAAPKAKTK